MKLPQSLAVAACLIFVSACSDQNTIDTMSAPINDLSVDTGEQQTAAIELNTRTGSARQNLLPGNNWYRCFTTPWESRPHSDTIVVQEGDCWYMAAYVQPGQRFQFRCDSEVVSSGRARMEMTFFDRHFAWTRNTSDTFHGSDGADVLFLDNTVSTSGNEIAAAITLTSGDVFGEVTSPGEPGDPGVPANFYNCLLIDITQ